MKNNKILRRRLLTLAVPILLAIVFLKTGVYEASNLPTTPDSVEYAIAAHNYVTEGVCKISYCGQWFPMRYPPWFSLFIIVPAFKVFGLAIGNAVIPVFLFGVAGVILAFFLGKSISNSFGGFVASLLLLALPLYRAYSKVVMTDIPSTVLLLGTALLFVDSQRRKNTSLLLLFTAGAVVSLSASLRPLTIVAALPFVFVFFLPNSKLSFVRKLLALLVFSVPSVLFLGAAMYYNSLNFGSPFRNGYNYWCSIPYDYPTLTFSIGYIFRNASVFLQTFIPFLLVAFILVFMLPKFKGVKFHSLTFLKSTEFYSLLFFTAMISFFIVGFHLLYFYSERRFFLPVESLLVVLIGGAYADFLPLRFKRGRALVISSLVVVCLFLVLKFTFTPTENFDYNRRVVVDEILAKTPSNAVVISSIDPIYLNFMTRLSVGADRIVVPTSRRVEYASKLIMQRNTQKLFPPPTRWWRHCDKRLIELGAKKAIPWVANEDFSILLALAREGRPVYIDVTHISKQEYMEFKQIYSGRFSAVRSSKHLFQLFN
jgi:4-amino-4-deoxy-L-arabinose transferase-like glycosyltransferase